MATKGWNTVAGSKKQKTMQINIYMVDFGLVPTEGFEPPHLAAHGPEPCASTNSATWALQQ